MCFILAVQCAAFVLKTGLKNSPTWSPKTPVGYNEKVIMNCTVPGKNPPNFQRTQTCLFDGVEKKYKLLGDPQDCGGEEYK